MSTFGSGSGGASETRVAAVEAAVEGLSSALAADIDASTESFAEAADSRQAGDAANASAIVLERDARVAADTVLSDRIAEEVAARAAGDLITSLAPGYAVSPVDTQVPGAPAGARSALHYAAKAQGSASAAEAKAALTAADRVATGADRGATAADRVATTADRAVTTADRAITTADRVQTGLDRSQTSADRAATNVDRLAADAAAALASAKAAELSSLSIDGVRTDTAAQGLNFTQKANARTNIDAQPLAANLTAAAALVTAADKVIYWTGAGTAALSTLTTFGRSLIDDADASAARTTLGLGTMATQGAGAVAITGGAINGTPIGGTTPAVGAFTNINASGTLTAAALIATSATAVATVNSTSSFPQLKMQNSGVTSYTITAGGSYAAHDAATHYFRNAGATATFATLDASGLVLAGALSGVTTITASGNITAASNTSYPVRISSPGVQNLGIGRNAMNPANSSYFSVALGHDSLANATSAGGNTCLGDSTGISISSASNNLLVGTQTGFFLTTGAGNIFLGGSSGNGVTTGQGNLFIGGFTGTSAMNYNTVIADGNSVVRFRHDGSNITLNSNGAILPGNDNATNLGSASFRFATIFAGTATINTSDARLKTFREERLTAAERTWAAGIEVLPYQLNDALAEKGEDARLHWGVSAQQVYEAGIEAGIEDPFRYAFLCRDAVMVTRTRAVQFRRPKTEAVELPSMTIEMIDGVPVQKAGTVTSHRPVVTHVPVVDEAGDPVIEPYETGDLDDDGLPVIATRPLLHPIVEMEDAEEDENYEEDSGEVIWGVRYTELMMFMQASR